MSSLRFLLACPLLLIAAEASAAEPLGRLFFTPAQRASLDVARSQKTRVTVATEKTEEEPAPVPEVITYEGMVRRSDGKSTVWINNRALDDREAASGTPVVKQVRPDGGITLQVPQSGQRVELKVGQSVELLSGSIEERFSRRATAPKPEAKPAAGPAPSAVAPDKRTDETVRGRPDDREATRSAAPPQAAAPAAPPVASSAARQ